MTELRPCTCKHPYQQQKYGNKRVHNSFKLNPSTIGWRCTVCKKESS